MKIAKDLKFPNDAVTQTFAQVGRKGAGKTYLASMMAEQMIEIKAQVIIIDPIGNWWGLRVNKDGKSKGKDIFVIGGTHGDIPLSPESGKEIARILTEKNISVVLDISEFRKNERKRFVTDFAEEFFHLKKTNMSAVHLFLEEAQKFVPQRVQKDETRMLGAWEDIVRLGRNYGIGCSLITQRPQSVNKEVLSQVECLCVLQITGLHERKALEEWIQEAGKDRKIVGELPSFRIGEGYVWSPSWLRIFQKVTFNKKTTLDTSATPELGKATQVAKISKIDIDKLRKYMSEVQEKKQKELKDLKDYKEEVLRLKRELSQKPKEQKEVSKVDEKTIERAKKEGWDLAEKEYSKEFQKIKDDLRSYENIFYLLQNPIKRLNEIISKKEIQKTELPKKISFHGSNFQKQKSSKSKDVNTKMTQVTPKSNQYVTNENNSKKLKTGAIRILKFVAMFGELTKTKAKTLCGISSKGTYGNYLADLKRAGYIEIDGDIIKITDEGTNFVGEVEPMPTDTESLINLWSRHLKTGAIRMLWICVERYPNPIDKSDLQEKSEISSTGTFGNYLADLRRNDLIKVNGSDVYASEELFG